MGHVAQQHDRLKERLARIGGVFAAMSGTGGVGKSTVTACLADGLIRLGVRTGALDVDLNGPCIACMMEVKDHMPSPQNAAVVAARYAYGVSVMSMDMFLREDETPLVRGSILPVGCPLFGGYSVQHHACRFIGDGLILH